MATSTPDLNVTPELLQKYDQPGPRYTSYPTAPVWRSDLTDEAYAEALRQASSHTDDPFSLYVHIPFCAERCHYCGCNVVISKKPEVSEAYLEHAAAELERVANLLGDRKNVSQMHWGGGTPTYLTPEQLSILHESVTKHFALTPDAEIALEADPRVTSSDHIRTLRDLGFNRISMGVQDLDPGVQEIIGRGQTEAETRELFDACRDAGFQGINIDLIYGLPGQTPATWAGTIASVVNIRPDRLAIYSYAHLPDRLKHQRKMDAPLPDAETKYGLFALARNTLLDAGYRAIGMDHFALPDDDLAVALDERRLFRNFMGYTTVAAQEMVGVGPSAISRIGGVYAQNEKRLVYYYRHLDEGRLPTMAGCVLSEDDEIRGWVIQQLMCNLQLDFTQLEAQFGVTYDAYFAEEEAALQPYYDDGFLTRTEASLQVLPLGQVFLRNIAMVFDAYLKTSGATSTFSRTV